MALRIRKGLNFKVRYPAPNSTASLNLMERIG